jgi:hypothetical protein
VTSILDPAVPAGAYDEFLEAPVRTVIDGYMIGFSKRSFQTIGNEPTTTL